MKEERKWGLIATGGISRKLATGIGFVPEARVWSVVSRDADKAADFARDFGAERHYDDLDAFLADPELEVVAVGTPHPFHYSNTIRCLEAGKHVLCEKPMGLHLGQVEHMIRTAEARQRFLMEAMWMWFVPATIEAKRLIDSGAIGEPRLLTANFGFLMAEDPNNRFYAPELGGGALLDIGIYPLALCLFLFGRPDGLSGQAQIGSTGVDEQMTASLRWSDGRMANCTASIRAQSTCEAMIAGSEGFLRIHRNFWYSSRLSLGSRYGSEEVIDLPLAGNGYDHEIAEVERCLAAGRLESEVMSWQASRDLISMMDTLRANWGLRYPGE